MTGDSSVISTSCRRRVALTKQILLKGPILILLGLRLLGASHGLALAGPHVVDSSPVDSSRETVRCGINSLFVFLILAGRSEISLQDLENIPMSPEGASLLALREEAKRFNIDAEIRRYPTEAADSMPLPAIVHFIAEPGSITREHFNVMYKMDAGRAYLVDGTTGSKFVLQRSELPRRWTGFAMIQKRRSNAVDISQCGIALLGLSLVTLNAGFLVSLIRKGKKNGVAGSAEIRRLPSRRIRTALCLCSLFAVQAGAETVSFEPWRCAANGGINALYCYLRTHGLDCNYSDLLNDQERSLEKESHTAGTLARLATQRGLPLQARSLTLDELKVCELPIIVHIDGKTPEQGAFLLVLSISGNAFIYLNGPTAAIHQAALADFRRVWSGIALVPNPSVQWHTALAIVGLVIGVTGTLIVRLKSTVRLEGQ
jgi:hypothetical protein